MTPSAPGYPAPVPAPIGDAPIADARLNARIGDAPIGDARLIPRIGEVRIGDAERDRAVAALGDHFAAGRLDREEFDDRVGRALAARVRSDLVPLFADLPGPAPDLPAPASPSQAGPGWAARPPAPGSSRPPLVLGVLLLVAVVVAVATGTPWPLWLVLWGTLAALAGRRRRQRRYGGPDPAALRAGHSLPAPRGSWAHHTGSCGWGGRV